MAMIDFIPIILTAVLVAITGFYACRTYTISKATVKQAEATREMADEMARQRYSDSQPILIPTIDTRVGQIPEEDVLYMILGSGLGGMRQRTPAGATTRWHNAGKGVALNATFSLTGTPLESQPNKVRLFTPSPNARTALRVDQEKEVVFDSDWKAVDMSDGYSPRLKAEYQDIYGRRLTTVQEFSFDSAGEKAHLGELFFTVDARRLGGDKPT
jgi:hypothetical protein